MARDSRASGKVKATRTCAVEGCRWPYVSKASLNQHRKAYHSIAHTLAWNGTKVLCTRDLVTGKVPCPCGDEAHARFDWQKVNSRLRASTHSTNPNEYPDDLPHTLADQEVGETSHSPLHDEANRNDNLPSMAVDEPSTVISSAADLFGNAPLSSGLDCDETPIDAHIFDADTIAPGRDNELDVDHPFPELPETMQLDFADLLTHNPDTAVQPSSTLYLHGMEMNPPDVAMRLRQCNILVDPTFRLAICLDCRIPVLYNHMHTHRRSAHPTPRKALIDTQLPSPEDLNAMLTFLGASHPISVFPGPIHAIPGLDIVDAVRCTVEGCSVERVFSNRKRILEHFKLEHPDVPKFKRTDKVIKAHALSAFRGYRLYVEVLPSVVVPETTLYASILSQAEFTGLNRKSVIYNPSENQRPRGPLFTLTRWEQCVTDVNLEHLRPTAFPVDKEAEPLYARLVSLVRRYYHSISSSLSSLSTLTLRAINSTSVDMEKRPFSKLQESSTTDRYADFTARFLVFLLRHTLQPISGFNVPLHPNHQSALTHLLFCLREPSPSESDCIDQIHVTIFSLLQFASSEFLQHDWKDPVTLFLVTYHLTDDYGNTSRVALVPPSIAQLQWCFRATAALEIIHALPRFDNNSFLAYEQLVKPYLTDGKPTLFTSLRQKMALISSLAHNEHELPRFMWNADYDVLSIDGFPISLPTFRQSIEDTISSINNRVSQLCRGCPVDDLMSHIDSRTNPHAATLWFRDRPQNLAQGASVFNEEGNAFRGFDSRLLKHLSADSAFFGNLGGGDIIVHRDVIWEWFGQLDELVSELFYAVISTWGGGARGTECDHLKYEVYGEGSRHLFVLNGQVTIVTTYAKTQSIQGHGRLVARTPASAVSRQLLAVIALVYPAAAHLATYIMPVDRARAYLSYIFVQNGFVMDSGLFTKTIAHHTRKHIGIALGLRDWRQTMCTMLVNIAKVDFGRPEPDDTDLVAIHDMFAHSQSVANAHYALQVTDALPSISHTAVAQMQRVSHRWHQTIGQLHPDLIETVKAPLDDGMQEVYMRLSSQVDAAVSIAVQKSYLSASNQLLQEFQSYSEGIGSHVCRTLQQFGVASTPATSELPPLLVHPDLARCLALLFPGLSEPTFTLPQQAELVQSSLTNEHVLAVLPTGSGKSVAFFGAAVLSPEDLFLVVTPLNSLTEDLARRLASMPISGGVYGPSINPSTSQLVLVSAHQAGSDSFYQWLHACQRRIKRIFIDEAHEVYVSDSYRSCFKLLHLLTRLGKPFTFLSATIAIQSVPILCERMQISPALLRQIRAPLTRANIKYSVKKIADNDSIEKEVKNAVNSMHIGADDRAIIYFETIAMCKKMAQELGIAYYTSQIHADSSRNAEEKSARFRVWRAGEQPLHRWMFATCAFGEGIDFPSVILVISINPHSMLQFLQESGRLGRNGQPCSSLLLYNRDPRVKDPVRDSQSGVQALVEYVNTRRCRRLCFADFDPHVHSCGAITSGALCDRCRELAEASISAILHAFRPFLTRLQSSHIAVAQPLRLDLPICTGDDIFAGSVPQPLPDLKLVCARPSTISVPPRQTRDTGFVTRGTPLSTTIPRVISVQSNGRALDNQYTLGTVEMETLKVVLDRVDAVGCPDCWVTGNYISDTPHSHRRPFGTDALVMTLLTIKHLHVASWPYCFLCWVPFRYPCHHPSIVRGTKIQPHQCRYPKIPYLIPTLIALILKHDRPGVDGSDYISKIAVFLSEAEPTIRVLSKLTEWLQREPRNASVLPNCFNFILAFHSLFRELTALS
ncbi:hypothetical protein BJ138DRAFT_1103052 [Hygrophoropsis aurantiaca]|uniref:Uncharacterized protein n=1 Tax=Hygrophoropsis aurantiaca TaxID=72124 RepID=A0ACB8A641_9AGAM|nr:hypothetical protein BJ138DRAFT_1103052 [Hygrophoropsis aurantiaca]